MTKTTSAVPIFVVTLLSVSGFAQAQQPYPQQPYPQQPPPQQPYPQQPAPYPPQGYPPQAYPQAPPPPALPPAELDRVVQRIALYPDPLLAQVMAAATYYDQIPPAAAWADQHHYLTGDQLAAAINADQLPWDPSVQALLPFPNILDMMARDPAWTQELGNAFLSQQQMVMDAVQQEREISYRYGYLRTNPQIVVTPGPYITIAPVNPGFIVVPYYNPAVVFFPPRPGFFVGGAIGFNFGITLGVAFRPWGWGVGLGRFDWGAHAVFINNARWGRTWVNRGVYVHPGYSPALRRYAAVGPRPGAVGGARPGVVAPAARPVESHQLEPRSAQERGAWQNGRARQEEHKGEEHRDERR